MMIIRNIFFRSTRGGILLRSIIAMCVGLVLAGAVALAFALMMGRSPPVSKETHIKQVQDAVAKAGGETNIRRESRMLFARLSHKTNYILSYMTEDRCFNGLSGIANLGDVFHYYPFEPDRVEIRIHNSHFDTYFIELLNPDLPESTGFERIAGNVGFIKPGNRIQPFRSETNTSSPAAGSGPQTPINHEHF